VKKKFLVLGIILLSLVVSGVVYRLVTVPYIKPRYEPRPEPEPKEHHKNYKYINLTIYEKFRRPWYKLRQYGAILSNGKQIQFYGKCYVTIEEGDTISIFNWSWNWFYEKRWMEVYRNGTYIGTFTIWFT